MNKKFIMMKGLQGSGKSEWASYYSNLDEWEIISRDNIRQEFFSGKTWSGKLEREVIKISNELIQDALLKGKNIIIDDTNLNPKNRFRYEELLKDFPDYEIIEKFIDIPLEECIRRDSKRTKTVGRDVITNTFREYLQKPMIQNEDLPQAVIVDIDGTVAHNNGHRGFFEWSKVMGDEPRKDVCELVQNLASIGYNIIFVSGRDEICRDLTIEWINKYILFDPLEPYELYMRPNNNFDDDTIIKKNIFNEYIKDKYWVRFVLDDRNKVVDMWRGMGLTVLQVNYGSF